MQILATRPVTFPICRNIFPSTRFSITATFSSRVASRLFLPAGLIGVVVVLRGAIVLGEGMFLSRMILSVVP
jgi:hypothetical protein